MKHILFLICGILIFVSTSKAQKNESNEVQTISFDFSQPDSSITTKGNVTVVGHVRNEAYYQKKLKQSKKKKIVGIALSSLGIATLAGTIGGYFALKNKNKTSGYDPFRDSDFLLQVGVPVSVAFLATGIPFSIIGAKQQKKYQKKLKEF